MRWCNLPATKTAGRVEAHESIAFQLGWLANRNLRFDLPVGQNATPVRRGPQGARSQVLRGEAFRGFRGENPKPQTTGKYGSDQGQLDERLNKALKRRSGY